MTDSLRFPHLPTYAPMIEQDSFWDMSLPEGSPSHFYHKGSGPGLRPGGSRVPPPPHLSLEWSPSPTDCPWGFPFGVKGQPQTGGNLAPGWLSGGGS